LKEYEVKILDAQEKIAEIERRLFTELRHGDCGRGQAHPADSLALAEVDVLASLAHIAALRNYCRPKFVESADGSEIEIIEGRHPVIEQQEMAGGSERFVPNDLYLNGTTHNIMLLTGPNMAEIDLSPADCTYRDSGADGIVCAGAIDALSMVDRVFTRIGASDNLARGRSTFMVEMTETRDSAHGDGAVIITQPAR